MMSFQWFRFTLILFFSLVFSSSIYASTHFSTSSHTVYIDPVTKILYVESREKIVLIAGEVNVPLFVNSGPHFRLVPNGNGYTVEKTSTIPLDLQLASGLDAFDGDLNGDGYTDLFLAAVNHSSTANNGVSITLLGSSSDIPQVVNRHTQIQGMTLVGADISIGDTDDDGIDELIVTNNGLQQVASYNGGFSSDRTPKSSTLVGTTAAEFSVGQGGGANYRVPLIIPVGAAGLKPLVGLSYSSKLGNGVMGLGWQLNTRLSQITQCYRRNTNVLVLCLNGQELINIGDGYYRTEVDSRVLVQAIGDSTFKLHNENGVVKTLTRYLLSPDIYLETMHEQRGGAQYTVSWSIESGHREPLVSAIHYHGNSLQFFYETRTDSRSGYWMGAPRNTTQRLMAVVARADNQLYRQYDIFYQYDSVSHISKVSHIQECTAKGCLQPLAFSWSDSGLAGLSIDQTIRDGPVYGGLIDSNNDGRMERVTEKAVEGNYKVYGDTDGDGRQEIISVKNQSNGDIEYVNISGTNILVDPNANIRVLDLDADGRDEIIVRSRPDYAGDDVFYFNAIRLSPTTYPLLVNHDLDCFPELNFADVNGDRLPDAIYSRYDPDVISIADGVDCAPGAVRIYLNQGNLQFSRTAIQLTTPIYNAKFVDINGDGLADALSRRTYIDRTKVYYQLSQGNGQFGTPAFLADIGTISRQYLLTDLNADGLNDLVTYANLTTIVVRYNQGNGSFSSQQALGSTIDGLVRPMYLGDMDGDAAIDMVIPDRHVPSFGGGAYHPHHRHYAHRIWKGASQIPYISTFTDSYGNQHQVSYAKLTDSSVYTPDTNYGLSVVGNTERFYHRPMNVVKSVTAPTYQAHYRYAGARVHMGRHGHLGFTSVTSVQQKQDKDGALKSLVTTSYLNQQFPLIGKVSRVEKKFYSGSAASVIDQVSYAYNDGSLEARINAQAINNGHKTTTYDWQSLALSGGIYKTYISDQNDYQRQLSNNQLISRTQIRATWQQLGYFARQSKNQTWIYDATGNTKHTTIADYSYENTDNYGVASSFLIDKVTQTTQRYLRSGGTDTDVQTTENDYYANGLLQYHWRNRHHTKGLQTNYQYDGYGNATSVSVSAISPQSGYSESSARTTTRTYVSQGKHLASETNAQGHTVSYGNYTVHGLPERITDVKGLNTFSYYDALGRVIQLHDHIENDHYTTRGFCEGSTNGCSNNAHTWEKHITAEGGVSYTYWDQLGREVKTTENSLQDNIWIVQAWEYDQYGRQIKESVPQQSAFGAVVSFAVSASGDRNDKRTTYDELDRAVVTTLPGIDRHIIKDYSNELAVITIDPEGRATENHFNALGQLKRKVQPDGTDVRFAYNAQGLVTSQQYPKLDTLGVWQDSQYHEIVNNYDINGHKTSIDDPTRGLWQYQYNSFGELVQQTQARGTHTYFEYDALGRMLIQRDDETYSLWVYDQEEKGLLDSSLQYDISFLTTAERDTLTPTTIASSANLIYQEQVNYHDTNKLPEWAQVRQRNSTGLLTTSTSITEYDLYGRVQYIQLPAAYVNQGSLSAPRIEYVYNSRGHLVQLKDRDSTTVYQQINATDAFGNISDQTLGGNVDIYRGYQTSTGWATEWQVSNHQGSIIEQSYSGYNKLGYMGQRLDAAFYHGGINYQTWTDTFSYNDRLNQQLTAMTVQYQQNINSIELNQYWQHTNSYDALGNMRNKAVIASGTTTQTTFAYDNAVSHPHRLTSTSGHLRRTYQYDANGNVLADGEKDLTYNSWNKVKKIIKGTNATRFEYNPDRRRYLRVDTTGSKTTETLYLGDGYERVRTTEAGTTAVEHKFYVGGIAIVIQKESSHTENTHYLLTDYQGSIAGIADATGELIQRFRYNPYGEQIDVGIGVTGNTESMTTRAYTGHENIVGMNIIHMNGRIYDPLIGRMLQTDIIVQAPEFIISYNRYAYVWNNPINMIDPSGYEVDDDGNTFDTESPDYASASGQLAASDVFDYAEERGIYDTNGWQLTSENQLLLNTFVLSTTGGNELDTSYITSIRQGLLNYNVNDVYLAFAAANEYQGSQHLQMDAQRDVFRIDPRGPTKAFEFLASMIAGGNFRSLPALQRAVSQRFFYRLNGGVPKGGKTALPDSYWTKKKSPTQVTPGTRTTNDYNKASSSGGTYHRTTHYDEFGREIGQTHRTHHGYSNPKGEHYHPNPHHHRRDPRTGEKLKDPNTGSRTWPGLFGN